MPDLQSNDDGLQSRPFPRCAWFRMYVTIEDRQAVHFVKENTVLSPNSRSSEKLMHNIRVAMAKICVDNLSEEVKKGLREKAEHGHYCAVAHVGYVNNPKTRRIDVDPVRPPLMTRTFPLYASGDYSLKGLHEKANEIGLRHSRGDRKMTTSELHRLPQNPICMGDFLWCGVRRKGSHEALVTAEVYDRVQTVLHRKPTMRSAKRRYAFMGLLTCASCGCAMTAEMKKGSTFTTAAPDSRASVENVHPRGTTRRAARSGREARPDFRRSGGRYCL